MNQNLTYHKTRIPIVWLVHHTKKLLPMPGLTCEWHKGLTNQGHQQSDLWSRQRRYYQETAQLVNATSVYQPSVDMSIRQTLPTTAQLVNDTKVLPTNSLTCESDKGLTNQQFDLWIRQRSYQPTAWLVNQTKVLSTNSLTCESDKGLTNQQFDLWIRQRSYQPTATCESVNSLTCESDKGLTNQQL